MSQECHRFLRPLLVKLRQPLGNDPTNLVVLEVLHIYRIGSSSSHLSISETYKLNTKGPDLRGSLSYAA